jgi:anti-sigma regulatory factor (Ser/Thr protein kinase)
VKEVRHFPNARSSVTAARRFVTAALTGETSEVVQTAELLVSELASNCVRHTDSDFEIEVTREGGEIRIAASDWGAGMPVMRTPDPLSVSGRGLLVIDMLSGAWGIEAASRRRPGKTVWLTLTATTPAGVRAEDAADVAGSHRR